MESIKALLGARPLFFDGAMGTLLQKRGLGPGQSPETWNTQRPDEILRIHKEYLAAGADLIKTNTFGANSLKFGFACQSIVEAGVRLAQEAVGCANKGFVALDIGPSGRLLKPLGDLEFESAVTLFSEVVRAGKDADLILIETMTDLYEAKAALLAAKENSTLPVFVSVTVDRSGKLLTGADLSTMAAVLESLGADAIGLNCGFGPDAMQTLIKTLRQLTDLPIFVNPNAGLPRQEGENLFYDIDPFQFAETMAKIVAAGAWVVGGCCGTTPDYIAALHARCHEQSCVPIPKTERTVVASGTQSAVFDAKERAILIGERLNPTGKPRFQAALRENDKGYLLNVALAEQDAGADVLDLNVGLPELNEAQVMENALTDLQAVCPLPVSIDSGDPKVLERALRLYNGKALINSVTAKKESMEAVFPLVKKYGGVVVGLTITEDGIPETPAGRLDAAQRIVETAQRHGISKADLLIDPLTMAISADNDAARVTLESVRLIGETLKVKTVLGVSNVSFGLPERERVTSAFFLLALENGLDAAIVNPNSPSLMGAYRSYLALKGMDDHCLGYIDFCASAAPSSAGGADKKEDKTVYDLRRCVEKGLKEQAFAAAKQALDAGSAPLELIDRHIVPALNDVGVRFEQKTLFLPQLLMSAEAAKAGFEAIRAAFAGQTTAKKPLTIVLATVRGDVHDIGKNIVKALLENYGFDVLDLGRDVPPDEILDSVTKHKARLCGLSALMTTTVGAMRETIELLHAKAPFCKVMVGGAVLNQRYADSIGADFYGADAMCAVRYAQSLLEN